MIGTRELVNSYLSLPYHRRVRIQEVFGFKRDSDPFKKDLDQDLEFFDYIKANNRLLEFGAEVEIAWEGHRNALRT